jgi:hypothetical protein
MKVSDTLHRSRSTSSRLVFALAAIGVAAGALAAELPKRKPGLWEINIQVAGAPSLGPMQQCIDQNTDNLMQQKAKQGKSNCSVMDITPSDNTLAVHAVCQMQGSTATTDGTFTGDFDASYTGALQTRFSPPLRGISESNMTQQARWLGPCKPGQKPGDVVLPTIGGMNINEMMKDPRVKELLKKQAPR